MRGKSGVIMVYCSVLYCIVMRGKSGVIMVYCIFEKVNEVVLLGGVRLFDTLRIMAETVLK